MSTVNTIGYTYDKASQLNEISDSFATYGYDYDNLGRATQVEQTIAGLTPTVTFDREYDPLGLMTQTTATIGTTEDFVNNYVHDALGRMTQITQAEGTGNSVAEKRVDLIYDAASQLTSIDRFTDVAGTSSVVVSTLSYDGRGRLGQIVHTGVVTHTYAYDQADRLTGYANSLEDVVTYTYDNRNQLDTVDYLFGSQDDEDYDYDANGNRDEANGDTYTTGDDNRLTSDGTYTHLYDLEGNRTARFIDDNTNSMLDAGDADITEYEWDHRNRLTRVFHRDTYGGAITLDVEHTYDPFNQWIKREVDPDGTTGSDPIEQTFFLYEQGQIVLQFDKSGGGSVAAGDLSHRYLWGPAIDMLLADEQVDRTDMDADGEVLWALTDHLGSVADVVDNNATLRIHRSFDGYGNIVDATHYDASGVEVTEGQAGYVTIVFTYTGKIFEIYTGLQNNGARWYDSTTGTFVSEDWINADRNSYRYAGNEPTGYVDTNGFARSTPPTWSGAPGNSWAWKPGLPPVFYRDGVPDFRAQPGAWVGDPYIWAENDQVGRVFIEFDETPIECRDAREFRNAKKRLRDADKRAAIQKMRKKYGSGWTMPENYIWHHVDGFGQMELVRSDLHGKFGHDGGFKARIDRMIFAGKIRVGGKRLGGGAATIGITALIALATGDDVEGAVVDSFPLFGGPLGDGQYYPFSTCGSQAWFQAKRQHDFQVESIRFQNSQILFEGMRNGKSFNQIQNDFIPIPDFDSPPYWP